MGERNVLEGNYPGEKVCSGILVLFSLLYHEKLNNRKE